MQSMHMSIMRLSTQNESLLSDMDDKESPELTRENIRQRILNRRLVFKWLPVYCSNDVVHGSWWFVWGSLIAMLVAIVPLMQIQYHFFNSEDDTLPVLQQYETWTLLIISGFFFTIGSFAFVRAFEEPEVHPMFSCTRHCASDELFGAWMFLLGTAPAVPYAAVFWVLVPEEMLYFAAFIASCVCVFATYLFVLACYPSDKKYKQIIKPALRKCLGRDHWVIKHLQNDWLAGTWFFLYATAFGVLGSIAVFLEALAYGNEMEIFVYGISVLDCILFLIGSAYFVAGSYPVDKFRCYRPKNSKTTSEVVSHLQTMSPMQVHHEDTGDVDEML